MKILHALPALNRGGTERLVLALAAYQQDQGHSVVVATFDSLNLWPEETASLSVQTFSCTTAIHRLFRPPEHDAQAFAIFLQTWQPDVIHSHSHWTERIILACLRQQAVLLQHFHLEYAEWQRPRWHEIRSWFGRWQLSMLHWMHGSRFLAVSQATTAYYHRHLPIPLAHRLSCLPNFLALPACDRPRSSPGTPLRLLSVGRLVPEKRHDQLLFLAQELQRKGCDFVLRIVGDGPIRQHLETRINALGISGFVLCVGNQPEIVTLYDSADLFLHPATAEPFGLVILEAMARGLPCFVERSSQGPRDFLRPDWNGFCVDFDDPEKLAMDILDLMNSPSHYVAISSEAINTSQAFSLSGYWERLSHFYVAS
jgi:glycosyltransferase involved in cell wall biosynthesis